MSHNVFEARARACAAKKGRAAIFTPAPIPPPIPRSRRPRMTRNLLDKPLLSELRPKVFAADRFLMWNTPYGITQQKTESSSIPPHLSLRRRLVMTKAIKPSTLSNYAAGLVRFTKFCDDYHIPENDRMPASEILLATFVTTRGAGSVGGGAITSWLAGLQLWHLVNNAPWHGAALLKRAAEGTSLAYLLYTLLISPGSSRLAPDTSSLAKRDPVTLHHIQALRHHLDLTDSFDAATFAIATVAFWSCCRLGELVIDSHFNPSLHVSRSTPIRRGLAANGLPYITFHIPNSKTQGTEGADIHISDSTCDCSPIYALNHHLSANIIVPPTAPLFAFATADGGWAPMRRSWFLKRCNEVWQAHDLGSLKGHGFRIGGTTHLLLLGVDPWAVMAQGRWSSNSFLRYWRKCEEILPLFMGFHLQDHTSILSTMSSFKARLMNK
jgi:hypothetical protein